MNIRTRMIKIAKNLMKDVVKSFEMTEDEWEEYSKKYPGAERSNHTIIPNRKNQGGNSGSGMTDEQKKLHRLSKSPSTETRVQAARSSKSSPITLHQLSSDKNEKIRSEVASNPSTESKTLDNLSKDENSAVRSNVALHQKTSSVTLDSLAGDKNIKVKRNVARNENTRGITLDKLHNEEDIHVKNSVARHKNTSPKTLHNMYEENKKEEMENGIVSDSEICIVASVVRNENTPLAVIDDILKDDKYEKLIAYERDPHELSNIEDALVSNPNTPKESLEKILKDTIEPHIKSEINRGTIDEKEIDEKDLYRIHPDKVKQIRERIEKAPSRKEFDEKLKKENF